MSSSHVDLQIACLEKIPIAENAIQAWILKTLDEHQNVSEITLRIVDQAEMWDLNKRYRNEDKPTNVLAFPSHIPDTIPLEQAFLGDVIICPAVLEKEAIAQNLPLEAHWAHIIIHGVLHLLGYDHYKEEETQVMQSMETHLLASFGFANPYQEEENKRV